MMNSVLVSAERIRLKSAQEHASEASFPMLAAGRSAMEEVIEADSASVREGVMDEAVRLWTEASGAEEAVRERQEEAAKRLKAVEAEMPAEEARHGANWLKVWLWGAFTAACFAAEFVLTWKALCFLLNVGEQTVLGVLLGLAPPSGLAVIEVALGRLFESPWLRLRRSGEARLRRLAVGAMGLLLVATVAINLATVVYLASAREEAARIRANPRTKMDAEVVNRAVLWVSVTVTVDGAWFLMLALDQAGLLLAARRLTEKHRRAQAEYDRLSDEVRTARTVSATRRERLKTAGEAAATAARHYAADCRLRLAQREMEVSMGKPVEKLVEENIKVKVHAAAA